MVRGVGIAPTTRSPNDMQICCWNDPLKFGAGSRHRTGPLQLGRLRHIPYTIPAMFVALPMGSSAKGDLTALTEAVPIYLVGPVGLEPTTDPL